MHQTRLPALAAAVVAVLCGAAAGAQAPPAPGARVEAVRFAGVQSLDEDLVRATIVTRQSRCRSVLLTPVCALTDARWAVEPAFVNAAEVERDEARIQALYRDWGFRAATVSSRVVPRGDGDVRVEFVVDEGQPVVVRAVEVRGLDAVPEPIRLPSPLPVRAGEPFARARVEATQRLLAGALAEAGYALAAVEVSEVPVPGEGAVDAVVEVRPGPVTVFGPTVVLPGPPLRIDDVERRLAYRPGERYRPSALEHTAERLYRVPLVSRVFFDVLPAAGLDSVVVTTIGVTPGRTAGLQFGGAFSTSRCLEGTVGWGHRYLFGAPRVLQVDGGAANLLARPLRRFPCTGVGEAEFERLNYLFRTELREPIGADTWLVLGGGVSRESQPQAFIRRGVEARLGVTHMLTRDVDVSVAFAPERRDQLAAGPLFCGLRGVCDAAGIDALARDAVLTPIELSVGRTPPLLRRPPAPPPPGPAWMHPPLPGWLFSARLTGSAAGPALGSEFRFARAVAEGTAVAGRGRRAEAAGLLRVGALFADEAVPPHLRVFGGGPRGMRGAAANRLGPSILTVAPERVAALGCDPAPGGCQGVAVDPREVRERPTGGGRLLEAAVEGRWWVTDEVQLAAFVDVGAVQSRPDPAAPAAVAPSETAWSPGLGVLVLSPFGPLRADVALNTEPARRYPLLMQGESLGDQVFLGDVIFDRAGFGDPAPLGVLWRRLQFQLMMGLPF